MKKYLNLDTIKDNTLTNACLIGESQSHNIDALNSCLEYARTCKHNLVSRGFGNVNVLNAAISMIPLMQHSWDIMPFEGQLILPENHELVNTISWSKVNELHGPFTYLVVDSEGNVYYTFKKYTNILDTIKVIIIKNDFYLPKHLDYVTNVFQNANFRCSFKHGINDFLGKQCDDFDCIWIKQDTIMTQIQK